MKAPVSPLYIAKAPANIALIKYWGKADATRQIPANASLSMTLNQAHTVTQARAHDKDYDEFTWQGQTISSREQPDAKIFRHLNFMRQHLSASPRLQIQSQNTFPAACGLASSASGFAALTLAAAAAWNETAALPVLAQKGLSLENLANLARLGSGSAGRSFHPGFVEWRYHPQTDHHSFTSVPYHPDLHLQDVIVVIDAREKQISSSQGHLLAPTSPLFSLRLARLEERLANLKQHLLAGDFSSLGLMLEEEAMEMHAVMLSANPSTAYFADATRNFLAWLCLARKKGELEAYFTLDAGPNVHLLCKLNALEQLNKKIADEFPEYEILVDAMGTGVELSRSGDKHP